MKTSAEYHAEIHANTDAYFAGTISHEEFATNQRRIWDELAKAPLKMKRVLKLIRDELNAGSLSPKFSEKA